MTLFVVFFWLCCSVISLFCCSVSDIFNKKIESTIEKIDQKKTWLKFKLFDCKNREIRKISKYFKWPILKLIRLLYGSVRLKKEKPGEAQNTLCDSSTAKKLLNWRPIINLKDYISEQKN